MWGGGCLCTPTCVNEMLYIWRLQLLRQQLSCLSLFCSASSLRLWWRWRWWGSHCSPPLSGKSFWLPQAAVGTRGFWYFPCSRVSSDALLGCGVTIPPLLWPPGLCPPPAATNLWVTSPPHHWSQVAEFSPLSVKYLTWLLFSSWTLANSVSQARCQRRHAQLHGHSNPLVTLRSVAPGWLCHGPGSLPPTGSRHANGLALG